MTIHRVDVRLPGREYPVLIGHGAVNQINQVLPASSAPRHHCHSRRNTGQFHFAHRI